MTLEERLAALERKYIDFEVQLGTIRQETVLVRDALMVAHRENSEKLDILMEIAATWRGVWKVVWIVGGLFLVMAGFVGWVIEQVLSRGH